ncbi:4-amino-4-deoxychorismate lyase [Halobacteriales archaeon QS_4_70_19]|nr:MAG: 4-amino-4-deoxychorismate lyase [Halobacteriales archaeon QS_4_70_19]
MTDTGGGDRVYHVNGRLVPRGSARVSVEDRGFRYGDAAFETMRAYGGEILDWDRHYRRLERTCETLGMAAAVPDDLAVRVAETLDENGLADAYVRVSVSRGPTAGKLTPPVESDLDPTVVVVTRPLPRGGLPDEGGERAWDEPAIVQTVKTRRMPDVALPADAKTHNYLNGILARLELRRAASDEYAPDEALMRDLDGHVAEGATSNLFFVDDGTLKTPAAGDLLPGITREVVLELAADETFPVERGRYDLDAVRNADEAFLTNRTWGLRPIASVDGIEVGNGPITSLLRRLYDERVEHLCYP